MADTPLDPTFPRPTPDRYLSAYLAMPENQGKTQADAVKSFMVDLSPQERAAWVAKSAVAAPDETLLDATGKRITDPQVLQAARVAQQPAPAAPGGNPLFDKIRDVVTGARDLVTGAVAKGGQYGPIDVLQAAVSKASGGRVPMPTPLVPDDAANRYAQYVVPQTPTAAALTVAAPGLSKLGLLKALATGGAVGAGTEAVTGGSPVSGAVQGVAGAGAAKAIPAAAGVVQKWVAGGADAAAQRVAGRLAEGMARDYPELGAALSGKGSIPEQLLALQGPGQKVLSSTLQKAESGIAAEVPKIQVPAEAPTAPAAPLVDNLGRPISGAGASAPGSKLVDTPEAFQQMKNLTDRVNYLAKQRANGTLGRLEDLTEAKAAAEAYQQAIVRQLDRVDPKLATAWQQALTKYGQGARWLDLADYGLSGKNAAGTPFDPVALVKAYLGDPARYNSLPSIRKLFGAGELGSQPVTSGVPLPVPPWLRPKITTEPGRVYGISPTPVMPALTNPGPGGLPLSETIPGGLAAYMSRPLRSLFNLGGERDSVGHGE